MLDTQLLAQLVELMVAAGLALPGGKQAIRELLAVVGQQLGELREGGSLLEQALKKSGWRGPRETGAQRLKRILDRGRAEREEHGHGGPHRMGLAGA